MNNDEAEYKKLRWRCRRGMLELDLLLIPFFDEHFSTLPATQQHTFVDLLEREDPELLAWFNKMSRPADERLAAMVDLIVASVKRAS